MERGGKKLWVVGEVTKTLLYKKGRGLCLLHSSQCSLHPHRIHQEWLCHQWGMLEGTACLEAWRAVWLAGRLQELLACSPSRPPPSPTRLLSQVQSPLLWAPAILGHTPVVGCQPECLLAAQRRRCVFIFVDPVFFLGFKAIREKSRWIEQLRKPPEPSRGKQAMPSKLTLRQRIELVWERPSHPAISAISTV